MPLDDRDVDGDVEQGGEDDERLAETPPVVGSVSSEMKGSW